ncbi:MAG TPA: PAS domain S-box protein [Thermoanaerobaculia bacterium]|jgi:PAS domain S-box-containing protein|nr:PAS domain S-box protein [Thermoanaerobaculia bacterium]
MPSSIDLAARLSAVVGLQQEILDVASDAPKVMDLVVTRIAELTGGEGAAIALVDGEDLAIGAISGVVPYTKDERAPIAGSLAADALRKGDIIRRDDLHIDSAGTRRPIQIAAAMTVPLLRDGYFVGVVETFATTVNAFDDLAAYTLQLLGGMTSGALMVARAFREKQESEARYRMLFERNIAGVFRTTQDGQILDCNSAFAGALGYSSREELLNRESWDLYGQRTDREAFLATLDRAQAMTNYRIELKRKDGTPMRAVVNVSVIPDDSGWQLLGTLVEETPD